MATIKKTLILIILTIIILVILFLYMMNKNMDNAFLKIERQNINTTFAAHRVNTFEKLIELKNTNIVNIEIDSFIDETGSIMVGHDNKTSSGITLLDYFKKIDEEIRNFKFIWLDLKDLDDNNSNYIYTELSKIDSMFNIKHRVLIESRHPSALSIFSKHGWKTGYYLRHNINELPSDYFNNVVSNIEKYNIHSVTFDCKYRFIIFDKLKTANKNNIPLSFSCWDMNKINLDKNYNKNYDNLENVLLGIYTKNNL